MKASGIPMELGGWKGHAVGDVVGDNLYGCTRISLLVDVIGRNQGQGFIIFLMFQIPSFKVSSFFVFTTKVSHIILQILFCLVYPIHKMPYRDFNLFLFLLLAIMGCAAYQVRMRKDDGRR